MCQNNQLILDGYIHYDIGSLISVYITPISLWLMVDISIIAILVGGFNPTPLKMMEFVRLDHPNENGEHEKNDPNHWFMTWFYP